MNALRAVMLLSLSACVVPQQSAEQPPQKSRPSTSREECLFMSVTNDWATVDDQRFLIYGPGKRYAFLAQLALPTADLRYGLQLKLIDGDRNGRICGFSSDAVEFENTSMPGRILIRSIQRIERAEANALLATVRAKSKPPPKPVPSAAE
jgi:Family of unknown function (DUF6491)